MPHCLLTVHGAAEPTELDPYSSPEERDQAFAGTGAFDQRLQEQGHWVFAGGLEPPSTATVVDGRGEAPVLTDGPYLESKELIDGFWVVEAPVLFLVFNEG